MADFYGNTRFEQTKMYVVRYKPGTEKQANGEWMELELRQDLPAAPVKSGTSPADGKN